MIIKIGDVVAAESFIGDTVVGHLESIDPENVCALVWSNGQLRACEIGTVTTNVIEALERASAPMFFGQSSGVPMMWN